MNIAVAISHFLIVFNSSTNFIIYCSKDTKFRSIISKFLRKMFKCGKVNPSNDCHSSIKMVKLRANSTDLILRKEVTVNKIVAEYV